MELKGRLKLIADHIPNCELLCDIGTDHAYIPIYSVGENKCTRAVASDIRLGPLDIAKENIRAAGLQDRIETRLGGGLKPINENETDTIVIAGMGGVLICDILKESFYKAKSTKTLILQPMNAIEILREWLYGNGFEILDEELTSEGDKIYNVLVCRFSGTPKFEEDIYYYIGKRLIERKGSLLTAYLEKKLGQINSILKEMENKREDGLSAVKKYEYLRDNYIRLIKENE